MRNGKISFGCDISILVNLFLAFRNHSLSFFFFFFGLVLFVFFQTEINRRSFWCTMVLDQGADDPYGPVGRPETRFAPLRLRQSRAQGLSPRPEPQAPDTRTAPATGTGGTPRRTPSRCSPLQPCRAAPCLRSRHA